MAYVVARPKGRFEIRESILTDAGPPSRTLANFAVLTAGVVASAARRAERPFVASRVADSARRAGAPTALLGPRRSGLR